MIEWFVNENLQMDYFPQAVTYAMGTVKNNNRLNQYFIDNKILEKRKKIIMKKLKIILIVILH